MPRKRLFIIVLALLIPLGLALFPFGWLGLEVPAFGSWMDGFFVNDWIHALGHGTIFLILGLALLLIFSALRARLWLYYTVILAAGIGQEFFQLLFKKQLLVFDDSRDIFTDLIGATVALLLWRFVLSKIFLPTPTPSNPANT
jgi:hypothetical protein